MRTVLLAPCVAAALTSALGAAEPNLVAHTDPNLGVSFPTTLGGLTFRDTTTYKNPEHGYSLRYTGEDLTKADIYIYNNGLAEIPTGCDNAIVAEEANSVRDVLEIMEARGSYKNLKHLSQGVVPPKGAIRFLWSRSEYAQAGGSTFTGMRVSDTLLTGFAGNFIKVRYTYKKANSQQGHKGLSQFAVELGQLLEKSTAARRAAVRKQVLEAVKAFRNDPLSNDGIIAGGTIVEFAVASDEVKVTVGPHTCPWLREKEYEHGPRLLAAFIAGNIKAQLEKGVARDHAYEGVLQVIETYKHLRAKKATEQIKYVESWIALQKAGKLKEHVEKELKKAASRPAPSATKN